MSAPLVLLPGMMCDARLFGPQLGCFSNRYHILVATMSGFETIETLAENILYQAPPQFALCGLSMGGIVAMEIMQQAPERVTRLALLDTNPLQDAPENYSIRHAQMEKVKVGKLRDVMRDELKPRYLADSPNREQVLDLCMTMAMDLGPEVFIQQSMALIKRPDQCRTLSKIKIPTLVLHGEQDRLCDTEKHKLMSDLVENAVRVVVPHSGHLPVLENPEFTNRALAEWLEFH